MLRRTFGFFVSLGFVGWAGYQLAYNQDLLDDLGGTGFFFIFAVALVVAVLLLKWPNRITLVVSFILGGLAFTWGDDVFEKITWSGVGMLAVALVLLTLLWAVVCGPDSWFKGVSSHFQNNKRKLINKLPKPKSYDADDDAPATAPRIVS